MNENNFKPFQKVLVRDSDEKKWGLNLFSHYDETAIKYPFMCISGCFVCCIPYEGNEHLLGTTDSPQSKRWRAKKGEQYWFISSCEVCMSRDFREDYVDKRHEVGNYFRTREEAKKMAVKFKEMLKGGNDK